MRIAQEEVFGPVLSVIKFKDEEEAVAIANDIAYGLGAGIWTQSVKRAHSVARRIRAGTVWVNTYRAVSFLMPLGGYKAWTGCWPYPAAGIAANMGPYCTNPRGGHDEAICPGRHHDPSRGGAAGGVLSGAWSSSPR